jgi:CubicO group peptidase (beta-lactamase class C family)
MEEIAPRSSQLALANCAAARPQMRVFPLLTLASVLLVGAAFAQDDISADLDSLRATYNMPGLSAMAVKNGRVIAQGAAGYRREGDATPLLVSDRINIGSCTKWMTATIAGRMVDRGVISWNTRVRDLFSNYASFNSAFYDATLDQLLAHRAGVEQGITFESNHWSQLMAQNGTISQIRRWVSETVLTDSPEVTPGNYLYSNQGYAVAATMMELASGQDWETLIEQEILSPMRMNSASLGIVYDDALPPKNPVGHDLSSGSTVPTPRAAMDSATLYRYQASNGPGGFVICTLLDWAKFLNVQATGSIGTYLSSATFSRLQTPFTGAGTEGYARGVLAVNRSWATPGQALTHDGDIFGEDCVHWMSPGRDFIVVVFANCRSQDNSTFNAMDGAAGLLVSRYSNATTANGPLLEQPTPLLSPITNGFAFTFTTLPGVTYRIDTSSSLTSWESVNGASGQVATDLQTTFSDTNPGMRKFYRAVVP